MTLVIVPPGRGRWSPLLVQITGRRAGPLLQRKGDRVQLLGRTWRVVEVRP